MKHWWLFDDCAYHTLFFLSKLCTRNNSSHFGYHIAVWLSLSACVCVYVHVIAPWICFFLFKSLECMKEHIFSPGICRLFIYNFSLTRYTVLTEMFPLRLTQLLATPLCLITGLLMGALLPLANLNHFKSALSILCTVPFWGCCFLVLTSSP